MNQSGADWARYSLLRRAEETLLLAAAPACKPIAGAAASVVVAFSLHRRDKAFPTHTHTNRTRARRVVSLRGVRCCKTVDSLRLTGRRLQPRAECKLALGPSA